MEPANAVSAVTNISLRQIVCPPDIVYKIITVSFELIILMYTHS